MSESVPPDLVRDVDLLCLDAGNVVIFLDHAQPTCRSGTLAVFRRSHQHGERERARAWLSRLQLPMDRRGGHEGALMPRTMCGASRCLRRRRADVRSRILSEGWTGDFMGLASAGDVALAALGDTTSGAPHVLLLRR